ncbi:KTSC domain-containing protein [Mesorhizobium sp. M0909]|uniref:KTSC domain-containing protein n=1 Tax=unclassified Mesorhizobium TaxID=325217 RepID=UPI00333D344D
MPSTSIRKTEYDPDRRILSVWFVASGKRYEFEGVPPETFAAFRAAFAKGRYFNDHIRNISPTIWLRAIATRDDLTCRWPSRPVASNRRLVDALPLLP